jgi:hypothetical protein
VDRSRRMLLAAARAVEVGHRHARITQDVRELPETASRMAMLREGHRTRGGGLSKMTPGGLDPHLRAGCSQPRCGYAPERRARATLVPRTVNSFRNELLQVVLEAASSRQLASEAVHHEMV